MSAGNVVTPRRLATCALVGLGAMAVTAAVLIPTYSIHTLTRTPLDLEITTVAQTTENIGADVLDMRTLTSDTDGAARVDHMVPLIWQRFLTVENPSNATIATLQAGETLRRNDKQGDTGLISATVDRVTINRRTAQAVDSPVGSIQLSGPAIPVPHVGLQYRFPFHTKATTHLYFDTTARAAFPLSYVSGDEINDLPVYHFQQQVPPTDEYAVVPSPANKMSLPASKWGVAGGSEAVTMTRWYTMQRDIWVEPRTGVIVKESDRPFIYYGRSADKPELTVLKANLSYDENTIEAQVAQAKSGIDKLSLYGRVIPIGLGLIGALLLIAGIIRGLRGWNGPDPESAYPTDTPLGGGDADSDDLTRLMPRV